ncbi:MAG: TlpA family protein disulfide reductase, partial [Chloroflexi bacterium]|nr:TlpA family protein disulfide reductase [Chloroflexota bacterium]
MFWPMIPRNWFQQAVPKQTKRDGLNCMIYLLRRLKFVFLVSRSGKRWSKVDTIDLTNKKGLRYLTELKMEERPTLSLGDIAPEFEAKQLDGSTFRLADYRGEKAVLIDFWATWCPPCVDEIPTIKRIADTYRDQGLEVVGVSLDRDEKALRDFVKREKLSYVQVFEKEKTRAITKSYGIW